MLVIWFLFLLFYLSLDCSRDCYYHCFVGLFCSPHQVGLPYIYPSLNHKWTISVRFLSKCILLYNFGFCIWWAKHMHNFRPFFWSNFYKDIRFGGLKDTPAPTQNIEGIQPPEAPPPPLPKPMYPRTKMFEDPPTLVLILKKKVRNFFVGVAQ